jgi:hypothetical protein
MKSGVNLNSRDGLNFGAVVGDDVLCGKVFSLGMKTL